MMMVLFRLKFKSSPEYTYEWSGQNEFSSSDQNISELKPGNYSLIVTDANNCKYFNEFIIEQEGDFNYNLSITNVLCKGSQTGQIVARPSGGGRPHMILNGMIHQINYYLLNLQ